MKHYVIEKNLAARTDGCGDALIAFLEKKLEERQELVAVVDHAGTSHWIFRVREQRPAKPPEPKPEQAKPPEPKPAA